VSPRGVKHVLRQAPDGMETQFFAQTSVRGRLGSVQLGSFTLNDIPVNLQMVRRASTPVPAFPAPSARAS